MSWMRCSGAVGRLGVIVLAVAVLAVAGPAGAADGFAPVRQGSVIRSSRWPGTVATTSRTTRCGSATIPQPRPGRDGDHHRHRHPEPLEVRSGPRGFEISRLLVNNHPASFTRDGQELVISPDAGLPSGQPFTVVVAYAGVPAVITDPDESIEGWMPTDDGAFVVGEQQGSPGGIRSTTTHRTRRPTTSG